MVSNPHIIISIMRKVFDDLNDALQMISKSKMRVIVKARPAVELYDGTYNRAILHASKPIAPNT